LKKRHLIPSVHWKIVREFRIFNRAEVKCDLHINEKLEIVIYAGELFIELQDRVDFEVPTRKQTYARQSRHQRLTSE